MRKKERREVESGSEKEQERRKEENKRYKREPTGTGSNPIRILFALFASFSQACANRPSAAADVKCGGVGRIWTYKRKLDNVFLTPLPSILPIPSRFPLFFSSFGNFSSRSEFFS